MPLEQLAGIRAEPLAQVPAVPLEALERCRRAADGGLAAQQVREQRLVLRPLRVRRRERRAARPRARPPGWTPGPGSPARRPRPRRRPAGPPPAGRRPRQPAADRPAVSARASRASPPAAAASRSSAAAAARTSCREPGAVDLARRGPQPVPGAVADDRVRTARVPGPRHQHLQALQAVAAARRLPRRARSAPRAGTGRQSRAASAASSACGRSPATGLPRQRTSASRVRAMLTPPV